MCCWQLPAGQPRTVSTGCDSPAFHQAANCIFSMPGSLLAPPGFTSPRGKAGCMSRLARCRDFDPIMRHQPGVRVTWELSELGGGREGTVPSPGLEQPDSLGTELPWESALHRRALGWLTGTQGS